MVENISNLILELNSTCNNNCSYCYIPKSLRSEKGFKEKEYFLKKLDKYAGKVSCVDFTGGEPTLYPHLVDLVKYAKKLNYRSLTLVTNGRRLSYASYLDRLIDAGITRVVISFDGHNADTDFMITKDPECFNQRMNAIKNILSRGIELGSGIVVNRLNYMNIPDIVRVLNDWKVGFINIQFILPYVEDRHVPCRKLGKDVLVTYDEAVPFVKKAIDENQELNIKVDFVPICLMEGYEKYLVKEGLRLDRIGVSYLDFEYNYGKHVLKGSVKDSRCSRCRHSRNCFGFFACYQDELGIRTLLEKGEDGRD